MQKAPYSKSMLRLSVLGAVLIGSAGAAFEYGVCSADETPIEDSRLEVTPFGKLSDGSTVNRYKLTNRHGMEVELIDFGAAVIAVRVPDAQGKLANVVLHFDTVADYEKNAPYFGVICGRYAGRIGGGRFELDGQEYTLATNDPPNHEHGGPKGFSRVLWKGTPLKRGDRAMGVVFRHVSPDGDEGYPGELEVAVQYLLTDSNRLMIDYEAKSTQATPLNLTSHVYWNLAGAGDVLDHELQLYANFYLPANAGHLPTGEIRTVHGTPMDFTGNARIGARIAEVEGGYDHCFVLGAPFSHMQVCQVAHVRDPRSGREMHVQTSEPGVQFYTGNYLDGTDANGGYRQHSGFCLECQHFPDAPNQPHFPDTILRPGTTYCQTTIYHFPTITKP